MLLDTVNFCSLFVRFTIAVHVVCLLGCAKDGERATLHGNVTFANQPVERGTISLIPIEGTKGPTAGGAIEMGEYAITNNGPLPGRYKVTIEAYRNTGKKIKTEAMGQIVEVDETEQYIPPNFNINTELVIEISTGKNHQDFSL